MPPDGEATDVVSAGTATATTSVVVPQKPHKDPRIMAREYQLELCKKAMEENIIVYLGTGCGKTHIAVLLIYELGHLIRKPQRSVCIFLAPTVALVQQQAKVIEESIDFKVGICCGRPKNMKSLYDLGKEIEQYEVLVMTPQILLHSLSHSIIKMELIALLIFDECHHAQVQSSHPYAQIMKVFYKTNNGKNPRIFGMTASPVVGKGASTQANLPKSINSLENLLNAKVYSVEDNEELEQFVASPVVKVYLYGPVANSASSFFMAYYSKLEEVKRKCISEICMKAGDQKNLKSLRSTKKALIRMHDSIVFCLESLGLWGALQVCQILLGGDHCERNAMIEAEGNTIEDSVSGRYLNQATSIFTDCRRGGIAPDVSCEEVLKEPFFSKKLLRLIGILSTFRLQPNMKCIIFVNRIVTARSLSYILQNLKFLTSWKCDFLVGVHSGLKDMSRKIMNSILEKFRTGKLNLLVATKVGEEGLDIQTCCLVIRFDLPETVSSFIQSRGRARMPQSEYSFLVDSGNQKEVDLIENFKKDEIRINMEIFSRTSEETFVSMEEPIYKVETSGASISSGYSISLLHQYCAKLPHDEFFNPKPNFNYFDDLGGTVCHINLPSNAPIHQIVSSPQSSMEAAKKNACLKAIEQLHKLGALNNFLLPGQAADPESEFAMSDSNSFIDDTSRGELHEMIIPAILKESWNVLENLLHFNVYYIKFFPVPEDRIYKKFALFLKASLPREAERMELDLHLAHGRSVITKLVPSGISAFNKHEIMQAMNFQEMFLKLILDRSKFVQEFVPLGSDGFRESCPTSYLLLPVIFHGHEDRVTVDWETVKRCLSSPVFHNPVDTMGRHVFPLGAYLQLANGCHSISDIENSLVYAQYKKTFYFVTKVIPEKNGYSAHKGSSGPSHMEHLIRTFDIHLKCPGQPLLCAKPLFCLRNLLRSRKLEDSESHELDEYFIDLAPELCELKIIGFSKDIGSSISLLPSVMHRLENLLVAIELKGLLSASFSEAAEVSAFRVLEALTTERCQERLSLERLEILGDAFLKFAVSRHLFISHDTLDEGELTRRRSNTVNNSNLFKLAIRRNLQVYIRDQPMDPCQFFALGYPCPIICTKESEAAIHCQCESDVEGKAVGSELRCSKCHHWLHRKTVADVVEALIGAFVVDSGFKAASAFLRWIGIKVDFETSQVINACASSTNSMPLSSSVDMAAFEELLGYKFYYKGLLLQAFVHPSFNNGGGCYQRLEFLGDAVLDYLITSYLFSVFPKLKPGLLTDLRSMSVNNRSFANVAVEHSFHKFVVYDDSSGLSEAIEKFVEFCKTAESERALLEEPKCPKVLSDLVESFMGAVSLDSGFNLKRLWNLMISLLDPISSFSNVQINPVRELYEICQSRNWEIQFRTEKKGRTFLVEEKVVGKDVCIAAGASNLNRKDAIRSTSEKIYAKLKDEGHVPKTNYLEDFLKANQRMEPKLIGYDEIPVDVVAPNCIGLENLNVQDCFVDQSITKIRAIRKVSDSFPPTVAVTGQAPVQSDFSRRLPSGSNAYCRSELPDTNDPTAGGSSNVSARSSLYEICSANCWKPPLFECCSEEGPSHLKFFTYKVLVEIEEAPDMILEGIGAPRTTKKAAAEHAAEGALWYLENEGYLLK